MAVLKTRPQTILSDYERLLEQAQITKYLSKDIETILKINISWHHYYPACSTTPWQLEGVIRALLNFGYPVDRLIAAHNRTVVVSDRIGEIKNKLKPVLERYKIKTVYLNEPGTEWVKYKPESKLLVLNEIYPKGLSIPKILIGKNIIHLPTLKTHVFTTMTGAIKNAFGALLHTRRHYAHRVIHEALVDLLMIQKEIHPGIFAVMDGTIAGDGPGPRCMRLHITDLILASYDSVAIDSVAAKIMGFDWQNIRFLKIAHELNLGCADIDKVEVVGESINGINLCFEVGDTFASRGQKTIYHGRLKPLEKVLLQTFIAPWSYLASRIYHDLYWYPLIGIRRKAKILKNSEWGKLFDSYPSS